MACIASGGLATGAIRLIKEPAQGGPAWQRLRRGPANAGYVTRRHCRRDWPLRS